MTDKAEERPATSRRAADPELQVMARVDRLLADLDTQTAVRVVAWLNDRLAQRERREFLERHQLDDEQARK